MPDPKLIALTPGEPAGIGPDITLQLAHRSLNATPLVIADPSLLKQRATELNLDINIELFDIKRTQYSHRAGTLLVAPIKTLAPVNTGKLDSRNARYVLNTLDHAVKLCREGICHSLVTGPIHKGCIIESGVNFSGHTEYLGMLTSAQPLMMLATKSLRVALVTTHIPLSKVSSAITEQSVQSAIEILHRDLKKLFNIQQPRIAVTGLNPHAGEQGHLGHEEQEVISPVISKLRQQGMSLQGPLPADTAFTPQQLEQCDAVLTMYHDQGLPTIKHSGFGKTVNITLGLPIIRTSVDHGTALELAGSGQASSDSLYTAFQLASTLNSAA